ncbi:MAG: acetate--CoA ligase family protein [Candidatus Aenigmarchaeota archaeon]|nr:acetate--CoA ligase family protein [Candidatus Aenigmarchaeota archaeon]
MAKLSDMQAYSLMKKYRIPVLGQILARNEKQALMAAKRIGWPVALKISSPEIIHKTDFGGVELNVLNEKQLSETFSRIIIRARKKYPKAKIDGILVQEMFKGKAAREVIIGSKTDSQFGPIIMFGLGGVFVEVMKDVSFRLIPIERKDARGMIREIRGYPMLEEFRGMRRVNFEALEDCLLRASSMVWKNKRIKELDINPLFADSKGAIAADFRVIV